MADPLIYHLQSKKLPASIGNKANNLRVLMDFGLPVPDTYVCTWAAHERYRRDDLSLVAELEKALSLNLDERATYALRSSANIEDSFEHSFAGQFKSMLNVRGVTEMLQGIWSIWAKTDSPEVQVYRDRIMPSEGELKMGVIIQEMVEPVFSGVAFSKNPLTGLDEVIVEAVKGSGTELVQKGMTPARWVNKWGEWLVRPDSQEIEFEIIRKVVAGTKKIAKMYGRPVDLEWVYDGEELYWLQMRRITALDDLQFYSNRIAKDMIPGMLKPLVWSVNMPVMSGIWVKLFTELIGPNDIDPNQLARAFYYRAYFNMGVFGQIFQRLGFPAASLELMMGIEVEGLERPRFQPTRKTYRLLPRMVLFAVNKLRFSRTVGSFLPRMRAAYGAFALDRTALKSAEALMHEVDELLSLNQETAYYNVVVPLLMQFFDRMLRSSLEKQGVDYDRFDLTGEADAFKELDPAVHLQRIGDIIAGLDADRRSQLEVSRYADLSEIEALRPVQLEVDDFLAKFGHLSESGVDFSRVPWREDPDLVLSMAIAQADSIPVERSKIRFDDLDLGPLSRALIRPIYRRARQYRLNREQLSSLYTYAQSLFRVVFLALGERFVHRGLLADRGDNFYLTLDEIRAVVKRVNEGQDITGLVRDRKEEMKSFEGITPPDIIFGDQPITLRTRTGDILTGTPTSRGYYQGIVKVVRGLRDFGKLEQGDVLVIPFSDVSWTPLFVKAGAVVAESGGMLSHSSIIAREYDIPAVVSVPRACELADGTLVSVDGFRGRVTVHNDHS